MIVMLFWPNKFGFHCKCQVHVCTVTLSFVTEFGIKHDFNIIISLVANNSEHNSYSDPSNFSSQHQYTVLQAGGENKENRQPNEILTTELKYIYITVMVVSEETSWYFQHQDWKD